MVSLDNIATDLVSALKARDGLTVETLRGLKTRVQNEQIAKGSELNEDDTIALIRSEMKRRNDAATAFQSGGRADLAEKEKQEAEILMKYLPAQLSESDVAARIDLFIEKHGWIAKDFGPAMGILKAEFSSSIDGATLSRILKDKLK